MVVPYHLMLTPNGYMVGTSQAEVESQSCKIGGKGVNIISCDSPEQVIQVMLFFIEKRRDHIIMPDKPVLGKPIQWEREVIRLCSDLKNKLFYTFYSTGRAVVRLPDGRECEYPNNKGKSKNLPIVKELQNLVGYALYYDFKSDRTVRVAEPEEG